MCLSVADPGFPRRGGTPKNLFFDNIFAETYMKMKKNWTDSRSLDPPNPFCDIVFSPIEVPCAMSWLVPLQHLVLYWTILTNKIRLINWWQCHIFSTVSGGSRCGWKFARFLPITAWKWEELVGPHIPMKPPPTHVSANDCVKNWRIRNKPDYFRSFSHFFLLFSFSSR